MYSEIKLPWFSCLLQHSARKRGGLILQRPRAHMGRLVLPFWYRPTRVVLEKGPLQRVCVCVCMQRSISMAVSVREHISAATHPIVAKFLYINRTQSVMHF